MKANELRKRLEEAIKSDHTKINLMVFAYNMALEEAAENFELSDGEYHEEVKESILSLKQKTFFRELEHLYITEEKYNALPTDRLKWYVKIKQHRARPVYRYGGRFNQTRTEVHPAGDWVDGLPPGIHWHDDYESRDVYKYNELAGKMITYTNRPNK